MKFLVLGNNITTLGKSRPQPIKRFKCMSLLSLYFITRNSSMPFSVQLRTDYYGDWDWRCSMINPHYCINIVKLSHSLLTFNYISSGLSICEAIILLLVQLACSNLSWVATHIRMLTCHGHMLNEYHSTQFTSL